MVVTEMTVLAYRGSEVGLFSKLVSQSRTSEQRSCSEMCDVSVCLNACAGVLIFSIEMLVKSKETVGNSWTVLKVILGLKYHHNH